MTSAASERLANAATEVAVAAVRHSLRAKALDASDIVARLAGDDRELADALRAKTATFVTIRNEQRLRGCIGTLQPHRQLHEDVAHNAHRALRDPRMSPVTKAEWPKLSIAISLLTPPQPLEIDGIDTLYHQLRPHTDGLTLRDSARRATFLPSVWESLTHPRDFVAALLRKGGWHADEWPTDMRAERYQTHSFESAPPRPALEET